MVQKRDMERFWGKVNKTETCWLWTGGKFSNGYGSFWIKGTSRPAHRVAWVWERGPIPDGFQVLHFCPTLLCVRPDHLRLSTQETNVLKDIERFWNQVQKTDTCWLWIGHKNQDGYGRFWLDGALRSTHRVSWELTYGLVPDGKRVLHVCDVPACVRPNHLFLGTQADNVLDMAVKGRHGMAKLTTNQVREIRETYAAGGVSQKTLAGKFGVDPATISDIIRGRYWRHA